MSNKKFIGIFLLACMMLPMASSAGGGPFSLLWYGTSSTSAEMMGFAVDMIEAHDIVSETRKAPEYAIIYENTYTNSQEELIESGLYNTIIHQITYWTLETTNRIADARVAMQNFAAVVNLQAAAPVFMEHYAIKDMLGRQAELRALCEEEAELCGAKVAFCGSAFTEAAEEKGYDFVLSEDGSHANSKGNYLLAACMMATLTGESPVGNYPPSVAAVVSSNDAVYLQAKAWEVFQRYAPAEVGLPWSETFENDDNNAGEQGPLGGQNGWLAEAGTVVTNSDAQTGSQSLSITDATASHTFPGDPTNVWVTFWSKSVRLTVPPPVPSGASAAFYVNTNDQIVAYDSTSATVITTSTVPNDWNKFAISCDYVSQEWNLRLNNELVVSNFAFYGSPASFSAVEITEGTTNAAFVDTIEILSATDDTDSDGLPDNWEALYYGALSPQPTDISSNGVNTVIEAYVAGLNPTNPASFFTLEALEPLQWNAVSGRVYTIYWTTNLVDGFGAPWKTNITTGVFTDTTHTAENEGFYKIEVQIEP